MTQAFRLLGDPRAYYVELPRYRKDPPAYKYVFRNNLRQAYLRHLARQHPENVKPEDFASEASSVKRRYVALHHFHPAVVRAFYENPLTSAQKHKVPISITEHELEELGMDIFAEDRILSISGMPTGGYYFVPSYPHENAHDDLKTLIQAVRTSRQRNVTAPGTTGVGDTRHKQVPTDIQIKQKVKETPPGLEEMGVASDGFPQSTPNSDSAILQKHKAADNDEQIKVSDVRTKEVVNESTKADFDVGEFEANFEPSPMVEEQTEFEPFPKVDVGEDGLTSTTEDFDSIWEQPSSRDVETNLFSETIFEEENDTGDGDDDEEEPDKQKNAEIATADVISSMPKRISNRDRPWETPKYRRERTSDEAKKVSAPAHYIDPNATGELSAKLSSTTEANDNDDGADIARIAADMTIFRKPLAQETKQPASKSISPSPSLDSHISNQSSSSRPRRRFDFAEEDAFSVESGESGMSGAIFLNHQLPGSDPTLRIQVHNDLIAWESKRRSDLTQHLEYNRERWQAAAEILRDGVAEAQYAERLILGISKASKLFADSLRAVYDDKLLDDRGNAVKNSFLQNRLAKQRSKFEYSIENAPEDSAQAKQSMLLDSIVEAQLEVANAFVENTTHMEEEILPEIAELTAETMHESRKLELIGESIIAELKRSEIEVKNIWGEFCFEGTWTLNCSLKEIF
jgi:hypothetical protein